MTLNLHQFTTSILFRNKPLSFFATVSIDNKNLIIEFKQKEYFAKELQMLKARIAGFLKTLNIDLNIIFCGLNIALENEIKLDFSKFFTPIANIKKVILIGSGKGGVGKSTLSAFLAKELSRRQLQIGIADLDISGSSMGHFFNQQNKYIEVADNCFIPMQSEGIHFISMSCIIDDHDPVLWRGPIMTKAINQFLTQTKWPNLDYLILDTPPGTSDIHLSLIQACQIDTSFIVLNPDRMAINGAMKLFKLLVLAGIKVEGFISNKHTTFDYNAYNLNPLLEIENTTSVSEINNEIAAIKEFANFVIENV